MGRVKHSSIDTDTRANLTKNEIQNGMIVLESQLFMTIKSSAQNTSVTCMHVGNGRRETLEFHVLGMSFHFQHFLYIN